MCRRRGRGLEGHPLADRLVRSGRGPGHLDAAVGRPACSSGPAAPAARLLVVDGDAVARRTAWIGLPSSAHRPVTMRLRRTPSFSWAANQSHMARSSSSPSERPGRRGGCRRSTAPRPGRRCRRRRSPPGRAAAADRAVRPLHLGHEAADVGIEVAAASGPSLATRASALERVITAQMARP